MKDLSCVVCVSGGWVGYGGGVTIEWPIEVIAIEKWQKVFELLTVAQHLLRDLVKFLLL